MQMKIIVESEEDYMKWMEEQSTFAETVMTDEESPAFNAVDAVSLSE